MKYFLIFLSLSMLPLMPHGFASCIVNDDWPEAPCIDTVGNGRFDQGQVNRWSDYYFYKGSELMEQKFQELSDAIKQNKVEEWTKESHEHLNVYQYYLFSGRAPAITGFNAEFYVISINEEFVDYPIIEIGIGQKIQLDDLKLYFYDIEDSRCPLDVECIWEGEVTAMINLDNKTLNASIYFTPGRTIAFPPYAITMTDIQPHPISTEKPDYVATLELTRIQEFTDEQICGPGTKLVNGACIVTNPELDPRLTPTLDYDYGFNYITILVIVGIIGGAIGGIVFVIRRKRTEN